MPQSSNSKQLKNTKSVINFQDIPTEVLDIIKKLQKNNFQAFIVGGAIRDLLTNLKPKDFDIATDATPEQIKKLFNNARIIGRRFKLVHIYFGRELIEVSTFRSKPAIKETLKNGVVKDNEYGSVDDDAKRRDFSMNAIYFDPIHNEFLDFFNGIEDIKKKKLVVIGDTAQRLEEDPVRAIRMIRFSAKLKIKLSATQKKHILDTLPKLANVPYSRLFDEILKIFLTGHAVDSFKLFEEYGLSKLFYPSLAHNQKNMSFIMQGLKNTDDRIHNNKSINPAYLIGVFLWRDVKDLWEKKLREHHHLIPALNDAIENIIKKQNKTFPLQKRMMVTMTEIWRLQPRFEKLKKNRVIRLFSHPRFRAAYDFMLLRSSQSEVNNELSNWWIKFVETSDEDRKVILNKLS